MRKKKEVMRELHQKAEELKALYGDKDKVEELRACTEKVEELTDELNQISRQEAAERALATAQAEGDETREISREFRFSKFIRELSGENGEKLTGVEAEVAQMGEAEAKRCGVKVNGAWIPQSVLGNKFAQVRAEAGSGDGTYDGQSVKVPADGGYLVTSAMMYQEALRNRLVLSQAGATYMGGLVGNIDLIQGEAVEMGWLEENEEGKDQKKQFSKRSVSPMRCFVNVPVSKQLTVQTSMDIERIIINDIMAAHAELLEKAALVGTGTKEPTGILNTTGIGAVAIGDNGGLPTFKTIVDLETEIAVKNADVSSMSYLTNAKVRGLLKTTLKADGVGGYIWEAGELNGYRAIATNLLPSNLKKGTSSDLSPIIFGDWSQLWIMGWGGLDLLVDPYTLKKMGAYEVTLNAYHNVFVRRPEAFAAVKDVKLTAPAASGGGA